MKSVKNETYPGVNIKWRHDVSQVVFTKFWDFLQKQRPSNFQFTLSRLCLSAKVQQRVTGLGGRVVILVESSQAKHKFPNMIEVKREQTK